MKLTSLSSKAIAPVVIDTIKDAKQELICEISPRAYCDSRRLEIKYNAFSRPSFCHTRALPPNVSSGSHENLGPCGLMTKSRKNTPAEHICQ